MKIKAIATMIVTVVAGSGFLANNALAGTTSATLTVDSIVTMGTCTSTLLDTNDTQISTVAFGDVYISELVNKSKKKAFKIRFSDCAGIPGKKAKVKLSPGHQAVQRIMQPLPISQVMAQRPTQQLKYGQPLHQGKTKVFNSIVPQ